MKGPVSFSFDIDDGILSPDMIKELLPTLNDEVFAINGPADMRDDIALQLFCKDNIKRLICENKDTQREGIFWFLHYVLAL